jgi:hypothetical protein
MPKDRLNMHLDEAEEAELLEHQKRHYGQLLVAAQQRSLSLSERYKQWSFTAQVVFWLLMAVALGGIAVAMAYAVPFVFSVVALPLIKLLYVGLMVAFNTLMLAIWCDGQWAKRPAKAQIPRTVFMTILGVVVCVTGTLLWSPSSLAVLPSMLDKLSPLVVAWLPGLKVAALTGIALLWSAVTGVLSYMLASLAERCQQSRWGQFFKGASWGFALAAAALPVIFIAKFLAVQHLVRFFVESLAHFGAMVFAVTLPGVVGFLGGVFNAIWQGGVADASAIETHDAREPNPVTRMPFSPPVDDANDGNDNFLSTVDQLKMLGGTGVVSPAVDSESKLKAKGAGGSSALGSGHAEQNSVPVYAL